MSCLLLYFVITITRDLFVLCIYYCFNHTLYIQPGTDKIHQEIFTLSLSEIYLPVWPADMGHYYLVFYCIYRLRLLSSSTTGLYGFRSIVAPRTITVPEVFSVVLPSTFCTRLPATSIVKEPPTFKFVSPPLFKFKRPVNVCKLISPLSTCMFTFAPGPICIS
jgi:hypothetical protein